ncbi:MAG TPA: MBL fold metallo-hydrolase, partial [Tabrizicola sp.]|nr:MBL fold metallo-hydrolase [Tabrizicola sp.]
PDGDMAAYMISLERLSAQHWTRFLPGHGPTVEHPAARLAELLAHRRQREAQILEALTTGAATIPVLTNRVYTATPRHLLPAAERNVLAHLVDLASRNLVAARPALHPGAEFIRL